MIYRCCSRYCCCNCSWQKLGPFHRPAELPATFDYSVTFTVPIPFTGRGKMTLTGLHLESCSASNVRDGDTALMITDGQGSVATAPEPSALPGRINEAQIVTLG